jgi:hypothetical protein
VPVLAHRVVVAADARLQGVDAAEALGEVVRATPVPG